MMILLIIFDDNNNPDGYHQYGLKRQHYTSQPNAETASGT